MVMIAALFVFLLQRQFSQKLWQAQQSQLQGYIYALMAATEIDAGGQARIMDWQTQLLEGEDPSYFIFNQSGQQIYPAPSPDEPALPLFSQAHALETGQLSVQRLSELKQFVAVMPVNWVLEDVSEKKLFFGVRQDEWPFLQEQQRHLMRLLVWATLATLILLAGQWLVLFASFHPLQKIRSELIDVEKGNQKKLSARVPIELQSLVQAINQLLTHQNLLTERFKNRLADLAHQLKTPIAVQKTLMDRHLKQSAHYPELSQSLQRMQEVVTHQLQKGHMTPQRAFQQACQIEPIVSRVIQALQKVFPDANMAVHLNLPKDLTLPYPSELLLEIFGNVLENAFKWGRDALWIDAQVMPSATHIAFKDNGPGFPPQALSRLTQRGFRADENVPGTGHGLAIVKACMQDLGGDVYLANCEDTSGAQVTLVFRPPEFKV